MQLASSHNHIKITTKLQTKDHSQLSEIELNGNVTTTELKKPHQSRRVGDAEMQNRWVPHPCMVDKNQEGYLRNKGSQPHTCSPSPGFHARKRSLYNFWLKNQWDWSWWKKLLDSLAVPLKGPIWNILKRTLSEIQHQGRSLKGTGGLQDPEVSGIRARTGGQLSPRQKDGERPLCLLWALPNTETQNQQIGAIAEIPSTWLTLFALPWHAPGMRLHATQFTGLLPAPYLWIRPRTSSSQFEPQFGSTWKPPSPAQVTAIRLLCNSCCVAPGGTQVVANLTCTTQETPEPAHPVDSYRNIRAPPPCPGIADPPQRVEVGGQWSQPVLIADWPG